MIHDFKLNFGRMTCPAAASSLWWPAPGNLGKTTRTTSPPKASELWRLPQQLITFTRRPKVPPFEPFFTYMSTIPVSSHLCFSSPPLCCHLSATWKGTFFNRFRLNILRKENSFSNFHHFSYIALNIQIKKAELCFFKLNTNYGSFCVFSSSLSMFYTLRRFVSNWNFSPNLRSPSHFTYPLMPPPPLSHDVKRVFKFSTLLLVPKKVDYSNNHKIETLN